VSIPLAKVLDHVLGEEEGGGLFRRAQLKALVDLHGARERGGRGGELTSDETTIIGGALDMSHKSVLEAATPLARVASLAADTPLTWESLREVLACGHSRLPVHAAGDPSAIVGLILVKELFTAVHVQNLLMAPAPQPGAATDKGGKGGKPPAGGAAAAAAPPPKIVDVVGLWPVPRFNQARRADALLAHVHTRMVCARVADVAAPVLLLPRHTFRPRRCTQR
jgi:CBS domain containing-hemolysin-like protein